MDFLWKSRGKNPVGIECKWSARDFDPANVLVFARAYPKVEIFVVTTDAEPAFTRDYHGSQVRFTTLRALLERVTARQTSP